MIAVLCATKREAEPLLEISGAVLKDESICRVFSGMIKGTEFVIAVSGMGAESARLACRHLIQDHKAKVIVNLGICGAIASDLKQGDLLTVESVLDADSCLSNPEKSPALLGLKTWSGLLSVLLGTVSEPVFNSSRRDKLAKHCAVVDMEGLAVAQECIGLGVKCMMLKGVSDHACSNGREDLKKNIDSISRKLAEQFEQDVDKLSFAKGSLLLRLSNFTRVEHTVFSLPLLFAGAWLGAGNELPSLRIILLITLVGLGARTFGMAVNRIFDRDIDARNPRTTGREIPSGKMSLWQGYSVATVGLAVYLTGCACLGPLCLYLSPVPIIPLATYALLKRFTLLCHFGIGVCLATAPLGAYVAASGQFPLEPGILFLSGFTFFWISGFDIIYALQDEAFDRSDGVKSIPAALGSTGAQIVAAVTHLAAVVLLMLLWRITGQGIVSGIALLVSVGAFVAAYSPRIPLHKRFFPLSAIAGIAGAMVVLLSGRG